MQNHVLALGYFALSAFCLFASRETSLFWIPFLLGSAFSLFMGIAFFVPACSENFPENLRWFLNWLQKVFDAARNPPSRPRSRR